MSREATASARDIARDLALRATLDRMIASGCDSGEIIELCRQERVGSALPGENLLQALPKRSRFLFLILSKIIVLPVFRRIFRAEIVAWRVEFKGEVQVDDPCRMAPPEGI